MSQDQMKQIHHHFATSLFNQSWDLLLKEDRSPQECETLLDTVHASLYHWRQIGEAINILRGHWMLAHVYTMLSHKQEALFQAEATLRLAEEQMVKDWDLAYAYSAMARAYALNGDPSSFAEWYEKAQAAGSEIAGKEDRDQFFMDLNDPHWFGMK